VGKLSITQEFNYSDHAEVYNYADHAVEAQLQTVDASIIPPNITNVQVDASRMPPPETIDPCKLRLDQSSRRAVRIFSMLAKRMMLAHCSK
jgi:hypothetical protein